MSNSISRFLRIFRGKLTSDLDANNNKISSLGTPATATDAATKAYVDGKATWSEIAGKPTAFPPEYPSGGAVGNVLKKTASGVEWGEASGGTTDYSALSNKPQINSHELVGNQTLAALGIEAAGAAATAKGEAIAAAASDATQKANAAEQAAKTYTDGKLAWQTVNVPAPSVAEHTRLIMVAKNTAYDFGDYDFEGEYSEEYGWHGITFNLAGLGVGDEFSLYGAFTGVSWLDFVGSNSRGCGYLAMDGNLQPTFFTLTDWESRPDYADVVLHFKVVKLGSRDDMYLTVSGEAQNYELSK